MDKRERGKTIIVTSIVGFVILVLLIVLLFVRDLQKTSTLDILVAPSFAKVEIDGKKFSSKETIRYFPGDYVAKVEADGFVGQEIKIALVDNDEAFLYVYLEPTEDNANFYKNHFEEDARMQEVANKQNVMEDELYYSNYPIMDILPYETNTYDKYNEPTGFRIDGGKFDACEKDFCLQVSGYKKDNLKQAKQYLTENGFNPDDYEIVFDYHPIERAKPEDFPEEIRKVLQESGYFDGNE